MKESDLYPPLKCFLEGQGYEVKGEVRDCDVVAVRGLEPPVLVELKLTVNLQLLLQGVDRLAMSDSVYLGVPEGARSLKVHRKRLLKALRRLGLGLLTVDPPSGRVAVVLEPAPYRPRSSAPRRRSLLREFHQRAGDPTAGGSAAAVGRMTAYRQRSLAIAELLARRGPCKASTVSGELADPKARELLYRNVYGWFERVDRGVYGLSPEGTAHVGARTGLGGPAVE